MYDEEREEREFSWANLFIKVIIALIIILFIIWVISLINRKSSNETNTVTDSVFSENISKLKEVGKEYFKSRELPKNTSDIEKVTLEKLYAEKKLAVLKDKKGKKCSAKNSYVSVEKKDDEYEMKVYLECGNESDYELVTIICNEHCSNAICDNEKDDINDNIKYQYSKTSGGSWSAWSDYSDWSTNSVNENDTTNVETKVETLSYDSSIFAGNAVCENVDGYRLLSKENGICNYSKMETISSDPICPTVSGYELIVEYGFVCIYGKYNVSITSISSNCPNGYKTSDGICVDSSREHILKEGTCPSDYFKSGSVCAKNEIIKIAKDASCPTDQILKNGKCYSKTVKTTNVTYYRYRTRSYVGGTTTYKWSNSNNDKKLLSEGYILSGVKGMLEK